MCFVCMSEFMSIYVFEYVLVMSSVSTAMASELS